MSKSKFLRVNIKDLIKGLIMVIGAAMLTSVYQILAVVGFDWGWRQIENILVVASMTGITYLLKNLFSNSDNMFAKGEYRKRSSITKDSVV